MLERAETRDAGSEGVADAASRYAVYFVPEAGTPLAEFGARWLGYDCESGEAVPREQLGLDADLANEAVSAPSLYGFHATLVAPFRLRDGGSPAALAGRVKAVACSIAKVPAIRLKLSRLGNFLALLAEDQADVARLAMRCTFALDGFRAPVTEEERARRLKAGLGTHQRILLEMYGYPYVLSEYRFHMTLTGALTGADRQMIEPALCEALDPVLSEPATVGALCLMRQAEPGARFRVHTRMPFAA